jgi:fatty acid synthase
MKFLKTPVSFPVVRGTRMLSPLVRWDHSTAWAVPKYSDFSTGGSGRSNDAKYEVSIDGDSEDKYIEGDFCVCVFV